MDVHYLRTPLHITWSNAENNYLKSSKHFTKLSNFQRKLNINSFQINLRSTQVSVQTPDNPHCKGYDTLRKILHRIQSKPQQTH